MRRWLLFRGASTRYPFILAIEKEPSRFTLFEVQDRWPGVRGKIFCHKLGEKEAGELPEGEPLEECEILSLSLYGRKMEIVLNRKVRKRCFFVTLKKEYKTRPGEYYEQVFWITETSARAKGRKAYLPQGGKREPFTVLIDFRERYPYRFPGCVTERENLPAGDYGLLQEGRLIAVVERKTPENFFSTLRLALQELRTFPYRAVVLECSYGDLLNPKENRFYSPSYIADILAELTIQFPDIPIVFCGNRKHANEWTFRFLKRVHELTSLSDSTN